MVEMQPKVHHQTIQVSTFILKIMFTSIHRCFHYRKCKIKEICGTEVLREIAYCYTEGSFCQSWINNQVKHHPSQSKLALTLPQLNSVHPPIEKVDTTPSLDETTTITSNYMYSEYTPKNIKCGIPAVRNKSKHVFMGMLKIIGGKTSRKGQWPWQIAILNRFKVIITSILSITRHNILNSVYLTPSISILIFKCMKPHYV